MAYGKFNDLWDWSLDKRKVRMLRSLVPCCVQDGYQAQVTQKPI